MIYYLRETICDAKWKRDEIIKSLKEGDREAFFDVV